MKSDITRRRLLKTGGVSIGRAIMYRTNSFIQTEIPDSFPWTWKQIKPESIQEKAYQSAWAKIGCMYGVVESVLGTLSDNYGAPYDSFPVAATV